LQEWEREKEEVRRVKIVDRGNKTMKGTGGLLEVGGEGERHRP